MAPANLQASPTCGNINAHSIGQAACDETKAAADNAVGKRAERSEAGSELKLRSKVITHEALRVHQTIRGVREVRHEGEVAFDCRVRILQHAKIAVAPVQLVREQDSDPSPHWAARAVVPVSRAVVSIITSHVMMQKAL